jgi:hypothetical protein
MGLLDRWMKRADNAKSEMDAEYAEEKRLETAKIRAFRVAEEMTAASAKLLKLSEELKEEIEAINSE